MVTGMVTFYNLPLIIELQFRLLFSIAECFSINIFAASKPESRRRWILTAVSIKVERFLPALTGKTNLMIFTPKISSSWRSSPNLSTLATSIHFLTLITNSIAFGAPTAETPSKSRILIMSSARISRCSCQFGWRTFQTIADSFQNYRIIGNQPMSASNQIESAFWFTNARIARNQHAESILFPLKRRADSFAARTLLING